MCRADARGADEVLVGDGQAVERTHRFSPSEGIVGSARALQCALRKQRDDGVDRRIDAGDVLELRAHELDGGDLPAADLSSQLDGRGKAERVALCAHWIAPELVGLGNLDGVGRMGMLGSSAE